MFISDNLGLRSDADVFAYYAETRFGTLCRYYARGFRHIMPALCRNFLKRRAWRDDGPKDEGCRERKSHLVTNKTVQVCTCAEVLGMGKAVLVSTCSACAFEHNSTDFQYWFMYRSTVYRCARVFEHNEQY